MKTWGVESYAFFVAWGEFGPTLEDVLNLMALPLHGVTYTMGLTFEGDNEDKLQRFTVAIGPSKVMSSNKSMYLLWIHYFDEGDGSCKLVLESFLAC